MINKNTFKTIHVLDKLIHRHPHIYGDVVANDVKQVKENWEKLKLKEGKNSRVLISMKNERELP